MNNVIAVFRTDLRHLVNNVIAAIVAVGLVLVPPMYAWFTTLGFWDPYSNTGGLKVAVADNDEGYASDLLPMRIDAGEQIVSGLRANDQFHWEFVSESDAVDGVRSGQYYAAIVIPKEFSADLMSVFTPNAINSEIVYYTNEKLNPIAPRITNTGASTLQEEVDEAFAKTVADVLLETTSNLTGYMDNSGLAGYADSLQKKLASAASLMHQASVEAGTFSGIVGSVASLVEDTQSILSGLGSTDSGASSLVGEARNALSEAHEKLTEATDKLNQRIDGAISGVESEDDEVKKDVEGAASDAASALGRAANDPEGLLGAQSLGASGASGSEATSGGFPVGTGNPHDNPDYSGPIEPYKPADGETPPTTPDVSLPDADKVESDIDSANKDLENKLESARSALEALRDKYNSEIEGAANTLDSSLEGVLSKASDMDSRLKSAIDNMAAQTSETVEQLRKIEDSLSDTSELLQNSSSQLSTISSQLRDALDNNDLDEVRRIIGNDPETLASFLSAPTELVKHPIYEMPNNGSAMSPFYSSLALWIGAIFLVALTSPFVSKKRQEQLVNPKPWQMYLGRYMVFGMLALLQAVVLCLGNVFFLGVHCEHFWLYLLACCVTAIVFSNIVYTLTISFGNVGKAIAIILLVMQLAGAGGIFPVQMSAPLFQAIYPWLPFAHSMEAFESAMAGIYGMQYWISLGQLTALIAPMLLLGLVLRRPIIRMNNYINMKLDETKLV